MIPLVTLLFPTSNVLLKWLTWSQAENHTEQELASPQHHGLMEHAEPTKQTYDITSNRDYLLQTSSAPTQDTVE